MINLLCLKPQILCLFVTEAVRTNTDGVQKWKQRDTYHVSHPGLNDNNKKKDMVSIIKKHTVKKWETYKQAIMGQSKICNTDVHIRFILPQREKWWVPFLSLGIRKMLHKGSRRMLRKKKDQACQMVGSAHTKAQRYEIWWDGPEL